MAISDKLLSWYNAFTDSCNLLQFDTLSAVTVNWRQATLLEHNESSSYWESVNLLTLNIKHLTHCIPEGGSLALLYFIQQPPLWLSKYRLYKASIPRWPFGFIHMYVDQLPRGDRLTHGCKFERECPGPNIWPLMAWSPSAGPPSVPCVLCHGPVRYLAVGTPATPLVLVWNQVCG